VNILSTKTTLIKLLLSQINPDNGCVYFSRIFSCFAYSVCKTPNLLFFKVKNMENVDGPDADKSELIKLEFIMDPDNPTLDNNYSRNFVIFKDLFLEE
jgi:hypothetical protein